MFSRLASLFRRDTKPQSLRSWAAAATSRLNSKQWGGATDEDINPGIEQDQSTIRGRSMEELQRNPFVEGVIYTHSIDVVGPSGPTLQVQSDSDKYNTALEAVLNEWMEHCDLTGQMQMVDFLQLDIRMMWQAGEYLDQITVDLDADGPVKLRISDIHPRRLESPFDQMNDEFLFMGIRRSRAGKPESYSIQDQIAGRSSLSSTHSQVAAANIIHGFRRIESGQMRGVPLLAFSLPTIADLREYRTAELDAARSAADMSIWLETTNDKVPTQTFNETWDIQRRQVIAAPPGYHANLIQAQHPTTGYVALSDEMIREIGRPVNMPLMMVKLDSGKHNYSSARFDAQLYHRGNKTIQKGFERTKLNRLMRLVEREANLAAASGRFDGLLPPRPEKVTFNWTWPAPPHVDPSKEAKALDIELANGSKTVGDGLAADGRDGETHLERLTREVEAWNEAGHVHPSQRSVAANATQTTQEAEDAADDRRAEMEEIAAMAVHRALEERSGTSA